MDGMDFGDLIFISFNLIFYLCSNFASQNSTNPGCSHFSSHDGQNFVVELRKQSIYHKSVRLYSKDGTSDYRNAGEPESYPGFYICDCWRKAPEYPRTVAIWWNTTYQNMESNPVFSWWIKGLGHVTDKAKAYLSLRHILSLKGVPWHFPFSPPQNLALLHSLTI